MAGYLKAKYVIRGIDCAACGISIEHALRRLPGVRKAELNYIKGTADVEYDPKKTKGGEISGMIEKLGYTVA